MSRGPKPLGDRAMTAAERQARFRQAHADVLDRRSFVPPVLVVLVRVGRLQSSRPKPRGGMVHPAHAVRTPPFIGEKKS